MDQALPRKNSKKVKVIVTVLIVWVFICAGYYTFFKDVVLNVSKDEIRVRDVSMGNFEEFLTFTSLVEPLHSMFINISEGGEIQEIYVENGQTVTKGQPLAKIYNPSSEFNYMSQENALLEQINNLIVSKNNIRSQEVNLMKDMISVEHDYKASELAYELDNKLFKQEVLSLSDYQRTQENYRYQQERKILIEQSIENQKRYNNQQIQQIDNSLVVLQKSLHKLRSNKDNFLLKAPISGRLSSFDAVLGQTYQNGQSIGKIDVMQGYKLVAQVDEFYIDKISLNQSGQVAYKDQVLLVRVAKIIPEVKSGRFEVQLDFESNNKDLAFQIGSSLGVKLFLSAKEQKLLLPKGSFYQQSKGEWVFVVKDGRATKRNIEINRENPNYYEVVSGLQEGEQVIVSSYQDFLNVEFLNIK
ncbi:efflux RND transporter periplasmic adaptor subunit [Myroides sp. LJL119]